MTDIEINDIAKIGCVRDTPDYMLPPEAWTLALNMRVVDGGLESMLGWSSTFGTPPVAPHFAMPISTAGAFYWLYTSLTKGYVYDGVNHTDLTRTVGGDYTANTTADWNGTLLGGIPLLNNGFDVPQFWASVNLGVKLANLTNWPSTLRAKILRAFGPYLMAFGLTDSGVSLPHTVQWSHPADPGSIPSSWDYTNPQVDAGRKDFSDVNSGIILDAMPLGAQMFVYKESSTWKVRFVGGRFIFDFGETAWITTSGILSPRCVAATGLGTRHIIATQDDIVWHDGNNYQSALDKRQRRRLFNEIDTNNYLNSFMMDNPSKGEMWFCYPSTGQQFPDRALVLYYRDGEPFPITEADGITFRGGNSGGIQTPSDELWSDGTDAWDDDTGPWSQLLRRRTIVVNPGSTKFYLFDDTVQRDGVNFATVLQRTGLGVLGQKRNGDWIVDHKIVKLIDRIWPKIQGGVVNIRLADQETVNGAVRWGASFAFNPTTMLTADPEPVSGKATGIEFSTTGGSTWRLDGYKYPVTPLGSF